jgi:hypothetical protein
MSGRQRGVSKLRAEKPAESDGVEGGWPRRQLLKMDARFCTALREALVTRPDPGQPARVVRHPARTSRR